MSEDGNPTTGGQNQHNDADFDANNSIIDKVKSRVSSIFPQTISKWFSPTTSSNDENNRNGSLRRRRDEQIDIDERRHQQNSDDSESDGGGSGSRSDVDVIIMPPSKKSRLNFNEDYPIVPPNRNLFASTPMVGGNRRKNLEFTKNTETPYNFTGATTSTFISNEVREIDVSPYIEDDAEDLVDHREWPNKKNISSRRSLNIPTSSSYVSSQQSVSHHKNSKLYNNVQTNEITEQNEDNLDDNEEDDDGDLADENLEDDDDEDDVEIRKVQKGYLTNGLRQSARHEDIIGGNLNSSTRGINRSGVGGDIAIGDSASESGESQCSSLIRQRNIINKQQKSGLFYPNLGTQTMNSQSGTSKRTISMANGLNFYSHLEGKKSLFSEKNMNNILNNSTLSLTSLNRRQKFNASLYGSTSALSDSRLLNTISPFYKGRTTYGGASAYNKYAQLSQQKQQRQLRVTPTLMRPSSSLSTTSNNSTIHDNQSINNNTNTAVISSTAKRILELMDQFTTPLNEVKKLASSIKSPLSSSPSNKRRFTEADLIASRGIRLSKPLTPYSRPISQSSSLSSQQTSITGQLPPPTSELQVPSMAQLLQLKRLQNDNEKLREIANSSKSILNQYEDYKLPNDIKISNNNNNNEKLNNNSTSDNNGGKYVNKIKNKITFTRQSNKILNQQQNDEISDIHLPNVQLPFMKSVPKIDIKITPTLSPSTASVSKLPSVSPSTTISSNSILGDEMCNNDTKYNISSRKPINQKNFINTNKLNGEIDEFIFSSPIKINDNQIDNKNINFEPINNFKFSPPVAVDSIKDNNINTKLSNSNKPAITHNIILGNKNVSENISTSLLNSKPTTIPQFKTGSVLDALKKSSPILSINSTSAVSATATTLSQSTTLTASGFGDKFKMSSNKWECSVCMIHNEETRNKCIACETPKTSATSTEKSTIPQLTPFGQNKLNTFGESFKSNSDTWECDTCMIRNKNDVTQCVACSAQKPGTTKSLSSLTIPAVTTVVKALDSGFKNIVEQQTTSKWECSACMTRNDSNRTKCICCEESKPGTIKDSSMQFSFGAAAAAAPVTSQFKFGFGGDNTVTKEEELINKPSSTDSIPKAADKTIPSGFTFSGQNSAKDFAPSTKASTGFTFGFKTSAPTTTTTTVTVTTESISTIASKPVSISSGTIGGFKFDIPLTPKTSETKTSTPTKTLDISSDNNKTLAVTTASTMKSGFSFGVPTTSTIKLTENSILSSTTQKLSNENKSESSSTNSAFKAVGGFTFGGLSNAKQTVMNNEIQKPQIFGSVTTTAPAESLKSFVFGGTTAAAAITTTASSTIKKDETLKLFSGFTSPTNKISETAKTTVSSSTFSSSNFTFGDLSKNTAPTNTANPTPTTTTPIVFGSGNTSSNLVFGMPTSTSTITPLFGASVTTPSPNLQRTANIKPSPPSFPSLKSSIDVPAASNQQPKPSLFGSPSSSLGSTSFGSNNNQFLIVPQTQTQTPTPSIFGSSFSASTIKNSSILDTKSPAASNTMANQQSSSNLFNFGGADAKNETTKMQMPTLFGNTTSNSTATTITPNSAFVFGQSKPIESTQQTNSIFGSTITSNNNNNNTAFGSTTFGSSSNNNNNNTTTTFGQSQQTNVNPFGSSSTSTNSQQLQNTGFGSTIASPGLGSHSNTSFGSAPIQPFGSSNTSLSFGGFGATNNNNRISGDSSDCSAAKKPAEQGFNFGGLAQNSNTGFSFGSNNNNNNNTKPAFNFSAPAQTPTPSFNFTGSVDANTTQPFQFGASSNTANMQMPLFNNFVGNESTPNAPFQFNAANNIFAPTPTPGTPSSAQQGRRKIRTATRRMNPR